MLLRLLLIILMTNEGGERDSWKQDDFRCQPMLGRSSDVSDVDEARHLFLICAFIFTSRLQSQLQLLRVLFDGQNSATATWKVQGQARKVST